ncbi:MAG: recombinase family protein [Plesiomonas shigelloides]
MQSTFAYVRVSTAAQKTDSQLSDIKAAYPDMIDRNVHIDFGVSGTVEAKQRPEFSTLIGKLRAGDTLIVWWIDRLGRDYQDVKAVMTELMRTGVIIKTINQNITFAYTGNDMQDMVTDIQMNMITAMASAERKNRLASAEAGRKALLESDGSKGAKWKAAFTGRKADEQLHAQIIEYLRDGLSIRKTAEHLKCGISTVQRVKKAITD